MDSARSRSKQVWNEQLMSLLGKAFLGKLPVLHFTLIISRDKQRQFYTNIQSSMATTPDTTTVKQMEEFLQCSVCMETLTEPQTLPCFHSFCKHCLTNFVATQKKAVKKVLEVFQCPVCRTAFHVKEGESIEKIPSNHFINNMLELLTVTQQSIKCQSCKAGNLAASKCVSCDKYLCEKCLETHNNWPDFEGHVLLTFEELAKPENRAKARSKPRCQKHNKVLEFYCKECSLLVCQYCVDVDHPRPEHSLSPLADVAVQHKEELKASCAIFEKQTNEAAQSSLEIEHAMVNLKNNATKTKDAIIEQQQNILSAITKKLEQETAVLLDHVDMKYKEANEALVKQQDVVKDYLEKAKCPLYFAKSVIQNGSDDEILLVKKAVIGKARCIENERPKFMKPVHNGCIEYQAKQRKDVLENIKLHDLGKFGMYIAH